MSSIPVVMPLTASTSSPQLAAESVSVDATAQPLAQNISSHEQIVTPWDVQGSVDVDGKQQAIDYDKLIDQFGTRRIDDALLKRFETLTGRRPHIFLRRGMFFSHREFDKILDRYEQGKPFFLIHRTWTQQRKHASRPYGAICFNQMVARRL